MTTTRRDVLSAGLAAAGAAVAPSVVQAQGHDHDHQDVPSDLALRVKSLESVLVAKGIVDRAALDAVVDTYEHKTGPRNGARVVARAWSDGEYKRRLLVDGAAAIAELGYGGAEGRKWWCSRTAPKYTTWWFAPCAHVIHGRFWVCHPSGTNRPLFAPGQ